MSEITIRPFAWADISAITAIYAHYVATTTITFDTDAPSEAKMAEKFGAMIDQGHPVIVAERDGKLLGYAYASTYRPRPAYRFTCENSIYLDPTATGMGLGKTMLNDLFERCRAFGFKQVISVITADTENSIAIHEKLGFRHVGRYDAVGYKFDRWLDIVHLQLSL